MFKVSSRTQVRSQAEGRPRGAFWPTIVPLFHGSRHAKDWVCSMNGPPHFRAHRYAAQERPLDGPFTGSEEEHLRP
jgi:hypothetical protein